jgi:2-oxoisovalerate dehydrogenase E2 component (dihydrolipoyl transacylase)
MGTHVIKMPDIGEGIAEVELVEWFVKVGDTVSEDQVLADVMTDKATVEIPSPVAGVVMSLGGVPGEVLAVGSDLIHITLAPKGDAHDANAGDAGDAGVDADAEAATPLAQAPDGAAANTARQAAGLAADSERRFDGNDSPTVMQPACAPDSVDPATSPVARQPDGSDRGDGDAIQQSAATAASAGRALAAPAVRHRATQLGVDLRTLCGSGPSGQILHADLDAWLRAGQAGQAAAPGSVPALAAEEQIPVIGLRRKIAERMQDAKRRVAHFSYVEEVDVTALEALRHALNQRFADSRGHLTLLPLLTRALVLALRDFTQINAHYDDQAQVITRYGAVHLGIATQSPHGLMVPVLRNAQAADLWGNAREIRRLAEAVRAGKALRDELSGSTLTLSSLGALGGIASTPVVNTPEVAIIGVNRIVERPMVVGGQIVIRKMMNLSSSFDHRVVDGMDAARFIQALRALLEQPALLLIE